MRDAIGLNEFLYCFKTPDGYLCQFDLISAIAHSGLSVSHPGETEKAETVRLLVSDTESQCVPLL